MFPNSNKTVPQLTKISVLFSELPAKEKAKCARITGKNLRTVAWRWMKNPEQIPTGSMIKIRRVLEAHYKQRFTIEELLRQVKF